MFRLKSVDFYLYWVATIIVVSCMLLWAASVSQGAISDAMDATCRIATPRGSCGTGCVFEINHGSVYVLTAAHVVSDSSAVQCEFWRQGHQSQPLPGRVISRSTAADVAIVAVAQSSFGGTLPAVIPLAPRDYVIRPGETLTSVGCANGAWSTGWKGHALRYEDGSLRFVPPPANGRSGSAIFDADSRQILAVVRARTGDDAEGIATPVQAIYQAFDASQRTDAAVQPRAADNAQPVQCGPAGCPLRPQNWGNALRNRQEPQPSPSQGPWPTLPPAEARPSVDLSPLDDKLSRIATLLENLKQERGVPPLPPAAPSSAQPGPAVVVQARKGVEAVLGQLVAVRSDTERGIHEVKTETAKTSEAVGGLTTVVEHIKDSISEHGTLSQQFHARVDKVKTDLDEKLGREATDREVRIAYVKDLVQEKISDGGLVGLAKALGLPAGLVLVVWLVTRDVKHKRETGDPLVVEKLANLVEGQLGTLQQRFEVLKDRLQPPSSGGNSTPQTPG
jgi:hypothetical protein